MKHALPLILLVGGLSSSLVAGETPSVSGKSITTTATPEKEKSIFDKIWGLAVIYKDKENPVLQELAIVGRQQNDYYYFDADQGNDDDWINRRSRIGLKAKMFETLTIHGEVDLDLQDHDPVYNKLTDAYIKWSPSKEFNLTVGKHGAKFTLDGSTSSTQLITIDRSNIANNFWFPEEYMPGVSISGEVGKWIYNIGYFSSGQASPEFGEFNAGSFGLVSIGYNLAETLGVDKAVVRADFIYQDEDPGNARGTPSAFTRNHEMVGSLNFQMEEGRFGFASDLVASKGYLGQPDLFGLQVMPSVYLNESKTFQGVLRYTYINSDGDNGIRLARYENTIVSGRGDEYNEIYAGLNYYIYGHKLKLQGGVQYTTLDDSAGDGGEYDGWGVTAGLRISW
ncbi:phosphate-selective porin OprO/OprP [Roseimicrobium gellanilyticum]|uniref:Phosphate-selective porin OprO/OprP n=1 Tax=Roseimicrobium gellanilyticum TaxID=748857 RepID=A0A366H8S9_9BACT|nr:porin [Roseimicrobium gellanilyticum]RBP38630.1 phosphate-selective porin OprO/OprP [Roseimicrobium gellanilyticum]